MTPKQLEEISRAITERTITIANEVAGRVAAIVFSEMKKDPAMTEEFLRERLLAQHGPEALVGWDEVLGQNRIKGDDIHADGHNTGT